MGVPVVGKRHHGEANTSQGAVGVFGTIPKRISGVRSGGRSSVNNQQSIQAQEPAENNRQCVMSAVFSHAVRWEFCSHNPISSGIPVGTGGQRGPSTGVRVSAKRRKSPLVLSPEEVILGLAQLEFRDQILVFLDGALGIRQGELGALHWLDCDFNNMNFS